MIPRSRVFGPQSPDAFVWNRQRERERERERESAQLGI